jgi:cytochrome oxidase Cu insertion factor (SCO1/SenC/PrrC family)
LAGILLKLKKIKIMKTFLFLLFALMTFSVNVLTAQVLPKFAFYETGNKAFTNARLKAGVPVVVVYFDPDCDHCNKQAQMIKAEVSKFNNVQMVWVAFPADLEAINAFGKKYFPAQFGKSFFFLRDNDYTFDKAFGYSEAPSIYIYNKTGKLVKSYAKKEVSPTEILNALK